LSFGATSGTPEAEACARHGGPHSKFGFIAEFRESLLPDRAGRLSQPRENQGDADLTDHPDSTDRSSIGSGLCPTSREEVFNNSTPIALG